MCLFSLQAFEQKAHASEKPNVFIANQFIHKDVGFFATIEGRCFVVSSALVGIGLGFVGVIRYNNNHNLALEVADLHKKFIILEKRLQSYIDKNSIDANFLYYFKNEFYDFYKEFDLLSAKIEKKYSWEKFFGLGDSLTLFNDMSKKVHSTTEVYLQEEKKLKKENLKNQKETWIKKLEVIKSLWYRELHDLYTSANISITCITPETYQEIQGHSLYLAKNKIQQVFNEMSSFEKFIQDHLSSNDFSQEYQEILQKSEKLFNRIKALDNICLEIKEYEEATIFYSDILNLIMLDHESIDDLLVLNKSRLLCNTYKYPLTKMISNLTATVTFLGHLKNKYNYVVYMSNGKTVYKTYVYCSAINKVIGALEQTKNIIFSSSAYCEEKQTIYKHQLEEQKVKAEQERLKTEKQKLIEQQAHAEKLEKLEKQKLELEMQKLEVEKERKRLEEQKLDQEKYNKHHH